MTNMKISSIESLNQYGQQYLVGGVSSLFRKNPYTGLPIYLSRAEGAYIYDINNKKYLDFFMGHGAILLGHKHPVITKAISELIDTGFFAEFDSEMNIELARMITEIIPCAEQVIFTNSGSESTQLAMRLARGYTGKNKIVRIDGHFHGVNDYVLFNNLVYLIDKDNPGNRPSKVVEFSNGIPEEIYKTITLIPWNNIEIFEDLLEKEADNIAGIMMNPIDYNNGCITTTKEYLAKIKKIAQKNNIILIFDEILSGFRTGISCAQGYYDVTPDICVLGKAISNGIPISVLTGKKVILQEILKKDMPVIHGGTYSGNRFGVAASIATLNVIKEENFYNNLFEIANYFYNNLQQLFYDNRIPAVVQHLGSNFGIYFGTDKPIKDYREFEKLDNTLAAKFFKKCIEEGLYFHTDFTISAAHTKRDIDNALEKIQEILKKIK